MTMDRDTVEELRAIFGRDGVLSSRTDLRAYGYDASLDRAVPEAVVFPTATDQVAAVMKLAGSRGIPLLPRGSGTNLSGGTIPLRGGLVVSFTRMNRVLDINLEGRQAVVEPGVLNLDFQNTLAPLGYRFAPDPSSQRISSIGGNVGENSGGPHCLRYGVTAQHVLGLEAVLADGEVISLGEKPPDQPGYNLRGLLVGSEGTLAFITRITVRLLPLPAAVETLLAPFGSVEEASRAVSTIIGRGILPACLEMMDRVVIQAVEDSLKAGYPRDAEAILLVELEGTAKALAREVVEVADLLRSEGAGEIQRTSKAEEREALWAGRRGAFSAIARVKPNFLVTDGTVPRTRLPDVLKQIAQIGERFSLLIGNVFHAGDGNLHPLILFDARNHEERARAEEAGREILRACVEVGGTISGEHGIGMEKVESMKLVCSPEELSVMKEVKESFDPQGLLNPGKILPAKFLPTKAKEEPPGISHSRPILAAPRAVTEVRSYFDDYAVDGQSPWQVSFPKEVAEVSSFLNHANREGWGVMPWGGGTAMGLGGIPRKLDLVLSLSHLRRIVEYRPADLTVTAEAGAPLRDLQEVLAAQNQTLPLDPPHSSRATLGGILATDQSGPRQMRYGPPHDLLLGLKVALADGTAVRFGGKTVKNVTGYDMCRLFAGSLGTLGIILEATFRLYPLPEVEQTLAACFDHVSQALSCLAGILRDGLDLSALEILNPPGLKRLASPSGLPLPWDGYLLLAKAEGRKEAVEEHLSHAAKLARENGASSLDLLEGDEELWKSVRDFAPGSLDNSCSPLSYVICRAGVAPAKTGEMIRSTMEMADLLGKSWPVLSHAACGRVLVLLPDEGKTPEEAASRQIEDVERLSSLAARLGGGVVVLAAPVPVKKKINLWGGPPSALKVMKELKARLDPKGILAPGRFVGGI